MAEEQKSQPPTIEQVTEELHRTRIALAAAMEQRGIEANRVLQLRVDVDAGQRFAQAQIEDVVRLQGALATAIAQNTELTAQLASRAQQRAGKKK